jgi:Protein of unknown function (DUF3570)
MSPRPPLILVTLLCPAVQSQASPTSADFQGFRPIHAAGSSNDWVPSAQKYEFSYQSYQEDEGRIQVESYYVRGKVDLDEATSFRFQWLNDAVSGPSPTGAWPGGTQPFLSSPIDDVRTGILGALSRKFGDHRVELEISHSSENDYLSRGISVSDTLELNQKNTTVSYGVNYLNDLVALTNRTEEAKRSYDLFGGISQTLDKNTVISANLTIGYSEGYLNDPYKIVQRNEVLQIPDGQGGFISLPVVNVYGENRPDKRFREVLQLQGTHYFEPVDAALDVVVRLSNDDYGVFSETLQIEWRQDIADKLQLIPFFRYYHQNAADFFVQSLNGLSIANPNTPNPRGTLYSADYRLSSFNAVSGGLRVRYQFNDTFSANAAYERYVMTGSGSSSDQSSSQSYISADIYTMGISAQF